MPKILDIHKVMSVFSLFSDLTGADLEVWRGFCVSGMAKIEARLRPGVNVAAEMEPLCTAAAAWAYSDYLMVESGADGSDELRVGDITLKNAVSATNDRIDALEIRDYFLSGVSHLLMPACPALIAVGDGR